jgi:NAD(P)-dependent dehydrogenase (short-subunit alcohol dehydrogenase family)
MTKLEGRVALITGGARGLGAAAARALAAEGAKVVISDIGDGTETAKAIGGAFVKHDVTIEADWGNAVDFTKKTFGGLDILVNNAGVFWVRPISMTTLESFRQMQQVNVEGVFLGLKYGIPSVAERAAQWEGGGAIVNISSVAGLVGQANLIAYNASKGAVRLMTKGAAMECAEQKLKVRINSVHPGIIDTPMMDGAIATIAKTSGKDPEAERARMAKRHPMGRIGKDTDVANAVLFLASDASSFMTGSELVVDGGMTAN